MSKTYYFLKFISTTQYKSAKLSNPSEQIYQGNHNNQNNLFSFTLWDSQQ